MEEERPPSRPWLTFFVFMSILVGFVLEVLAFVYLFEGLCENIPDNMTYCRLDNESLYGNSEGEQNYLGYQICVGFTVFIELFAVIKISCRVYCCVKYVWVPRCVHVWECCVCCGHCWCVIVALGVCLNIFGIFLVCTAVPISDMFNYIVGFRLTFGNVLFSVVKLVTWYTYLAYRQSCCPDPEYFLCSDTKMSECGVSKTEVNIEQVRDRYGTVVRERETGRRREKRKLEPFCLLL